MSATIQYKEFVITPRSEGGAFHCTIAHERGRPFAVGRRTNREVQTKPFSTETEAIHNAKLIASLATTRK